MVKTGTYNKVMMRMKKRERDRYDFEGDEKAEGMVDLSKVKFKLLKKSMFGGSRKGALNLAVLFGLTIMILVYVNALYTIINDSVQTASPTMDDFSASMIQLIPGGLLIFLFAYMLFYFNSDA